MGFHEVSELDIETIAKIRNGGWPSRDDLPTGDPIGDVEETYNQEMAKYTEMMKNRVLKPEGKYFGVDYANGQDKSVTHEHSCCSNPANHKKVHLMVSAYKMCTVCKADLGDWKG